MSRFALLILLSLILVVSVSGFRFSDLINIPASDLADPAACPNMCSNNGDCVKSANDTTCICNDGFLGNDCSVKVTMTPVCWINDAVCSYWTLQNGYFYQRLSAATGSPTGWVGFMFGSTDGMAGGQSTIFHIPAAYAAVAEEMYSSSKGKPSLLPDQSISSAYVSGLTSDSGIVVSYQRLADPKLDRHYPIPVTPGNVTAVSVAWQDEYFDFHMENAEYVMIDLAAAALNQPQPATTKPHINRKNHIGNNRHIRQN